MPPRIIMHLPKAGIEVNRHMPYMRLYMRIEEICAELGIGCEMVPFTFDLRREGVGEKITGDGNLHIVDDGYRPLPNTLNAGLAYINRFWHLDPKGIRFASSIGDRPYDPSGIKQGRAKVFFHWTRKRLVEERWSRYAQKQEPTKVPKGCIAVFLQGPRPKTKYFSTRFSDLEMVEAVLRGAGDRPVVVKPHPKIVELDELAAMVEIQARDPRLILTDGNIHDILARAAVSVSINSSVSIEGYFHRVPTILFGKCDFHHLAQTVTEPDGFAAALEAALDNPTGFARYTAWYFLTQSIDIWADDLDDRIWAAFAGAGFDRARFGVGP